MKNKNDKKTTLEQHMIKYCKQIGIVEPPTLTFEPKEFDRICQSTRKMRRNSCLGKCSTYDKVILVNLEYARRTIYRRQWLYRGKKYRWLLKKWNLHEAIRTLVHELVHYRWTMNHGYGFDKRIDEVINGKEFSPKQTKIEIQKEKNWL